MKKVTIKKILFLFILVFLASIANSCKATLRGEYKHSTFNYPNIVKNRFLVGDVIFNDSLEFTGDSNRYARLLKEKIIEQEFTALPSALYKKKMGKKERKRIEDNLKVGLGLDEKDFNLFKKKLTEAKYLIFVVVDFEELDRNRKSLTNRDGGKTVGYLSVSSRKMEGSLRVYDIQQGILVYSGSSDYTNRKEAKYDKKEELGGLFGGVAAVVKAAKGVKEENNPNVLYPYPDYPTRDSVLQVVFSIFAKSLPEED